MQVCRFTCKLWTFIFKSIIAKLKLLYVLCAHILFLPNSTLLYSVIALRTNPSNLILELKIQFILKSKLKDMPHDAWNKAQINLGNFLWENLLLSLLPIWITIIIRMHADECIYTWTVLIPKCVRYITDVYAEKHLFHSQTSFSAQEIE